MKKTILVTSIIITLTGCKYIHIKEPYLDTKEGKELKVVEGQSTPNSSSTLDVPRAANNKEITEVQEIKPPEMPIRTRQSDTGVVKIENKAGLPVLTSKSSKDKVWATMTGLELEDWSLKSQAQESCSVTYEYVDAAAKERAEANFIKKVFTRDGFYTDHSGDYILSCQPQSKSVEVTFKNADGLPARTFLADSVMNHLFEKLEKE